MNPQPDFSVVIPCFQTGRLILDSVASVMGQVLSSNSQPPTIEVIVVDDHSQDGATREALNELRLRHPGIHVLQNPVNLGVSATRNRGIAEASGRWIKFLDADDFWTPDHLGRTLQAMDLFPDAVWFAGDHFKTDHTGKPLSRVTRNPLIAAAFQESDTQFQEFSDARKAAIKSFLCHANTVTIRADVLASAGGFNPSLRSAEDHDLWFRLAPRHSLVYIAKELAGYRTNPNSITQSTALPHPNLCAILRDLLGAPDYSGLRSEIRKRLIETSLANVYHYRRTSLFADAAEEARMTLGCIPWSITFWKQWLAIAIKI